LKKIIRENLIKQNQINERFEKISKLESRDAKFYSTVDYINELHESGYSEEELQTTLDEQFDFLSNAFGWGSSSAADAAAHKEVLGKGLDVGLGGGAAMLKEWLVQTLLGYLGFEGPFANALSTALTRMSLMDLVSVFRSYEGCMTHSGPVANAIVEALVRYIVETTTKQNSFGANFFRNMLSEYIRQEGGYKKIGRFVCRVAYKNRSKLYNDASSKFGGRENFKTPQVNKEQ
jgi:hypothetical protein